jgi:hypothetical protein
MKGGNIPTRAYTKAPPPKEDVEQTCLFRWADYQSGAYPVLRKMYHIPNGGKRGKAEAARFKAQGVKAGVPDICLPVARGGCHGLYIELKRVQGSKTTPEQTDWMDALAEEGYMVALCKGWEEAARVIMEYLDMKTEP